MTPRTLRTIFAAILFVHAIGHIQGVLSALGLFNSESWHPKSWLFDTLLGEKASRILALILWGLCVLGFLAAGFAFLGMGISHDLWRTLAILSAIPSILGLIFYWNSLSQFFNKIGAIGVNTWVIVGFLILNWPAEGDFGF